MRKTRDGYAGVAGNALFLILIAVALFAALAYAVTQSSRGGGSATREKAVLEARHYAGYGSLLRNAIQRLQLSGCTDTQISFENSVVGGYTNGSAPSNQSCHVFASAGGGVPFESATYNGDNAVEGIGTRHARRRAAPTWSISAR